MATQIRLSGLLKSTDFSFKRRNCLQETNRLQSTVKVYQKVVKKQLYIYVIRLFIYELATSENQLSLRYSYFMTEQITTPQAAPVSEMPAIVPKKNNNLFLGIGIGVLVMVVIFCGYVLATKNINKSLISNKETTVDTVTPTEVSQTPLLTGQTKKMDQNLAIFKLTEDDKLNGVNNVDFSYYSTGIFTRGELKDYTRIVAVRPADSPEGPEVFVLATKDFQNYILDDPNQGTINNPESEASNPYYYLDKSKISSTTTFETEQTMELSLDKNYSLYREKLLVDSVPSNEKDSNGNVVYKTVLITDFSGYQKISSPRADLTFYFKNDGKNDWGNDPLRQQYLLGTTEVIVADSTGLAMSYALTTPKNIETYNTKEAQYQTAMTTYQNQLKKYNNKESTEYPTYPTFVFLPGMGFESSEISSQTNLTFFKDYRTAIPGGCAETMNTRIVNISDDDLEQIGTVGNLPLYRLKDSSSSLYTLAFKNKFEYYDQAPDEWNDVNKGIKKPTLAEYVNSNPLLFVKDFWGRVVALGEYDIQLPAGCGKPVIYLYPEKTTEVSVKFQVPVQFNTNIPNYGDSWQVMANSDGSLVNLKPELTNCQKIDTKKEGSEYAKEACLKNTYPYLFWAGNVVSENYPIIDKGWIVSKNNLKEFLQTKLTEVGLNNNEKTDFLSYWVPEMMAKNAPYYRVSFLQTNDLNTLFPMTVKPNPKTVFRLFLDYLPLSEKPQVVPEPETLNKLVRNGFTMVEWGGLKR